MATSELMELIITSGEKGDIVQKFERALRTRYHVLKTELAKIEGLIKALDKNGTHRVAKRAGRNKISAAGRKQISLAQKARWDPEHIRMTEMGCA